MLLAPSVNTFNSFSLQNPFFVICLIFEQKFIQILILPNLKYENYEVKFIESNLTTNFKYTFRFEYVYIYMILLFLLKKYFNNQ